MKIIDRNKQSWVRDKYNRVGILVGEGFVGLGFWYLLHHGVQNFFGESSDQAGSPDWSGIASSMEIFIISFPILFSLWWFRTYDVREQIAKAEEQIQQAQLFNGFNNLIKNSPLAIDIGVAQLLELSKLNNQYDSTIRLAFIRRLKTSPLSPESKNDGAKKKYNRLEYAQHILIWFMNKGHSGGDRQPDDKRYCDFENQMFVTRKAFRAFVAFCKLRCGNGNCPEKRPCHDCDYAKEHEVTLSTWNIHNVLLDGELPGRCPGDANMKTYPKEWGFEERDLENYKYYYRLYDTSKETSNQPK